MHTPSATELLEAWERGQTQMPVERALTLLVLAFPEQPPGALARLSIGQRDGFLLALRERLFGPRLIGIAACPACGDRVELDFAAVDVRVAPVGDRADRLTLSVEGYEVQFRLPNSLDLVTIADAGDPHDSSRALLLGCVESAWHAGNSLPAELLPEQVAEALAERMASADPQADVQLALTCPACGQRWNELFDIVSYLWAEVDAWAIHMLRDIHTLALHYSWREADILAMSAWRRRVYLGLLGA
jgi:hypothetical protein